MIDGTGTTTYSYRAPRSPGALMQTAVDGPLADDIIGFTYDELDRVVQRTINGVPSSVTYDELGRIDGLSNPLGTFTPSFDPTTSLPAAISISAGLDIESTRYDGNGDYRMESLTHKWGAAQMANFAYEYDEPGNITRQSNDHGEPRVFDYYYDAVDRLVGADVSDPVAGTQIDTIVYEYDKSDNRVLEQSEGRVTSAFHNSVNELWQLDSGGKALFSGELDEQGTVTIAGYSTNTDIDNRFRLLIPVEPGPNDLPMTVVDVSGNATQKTISLFVPDEGTRVLGYDNNGSLRIDEEHIYEWDAENRLVAIEYQGTDRRTEFEYDGLGRRVRIVESDNGAITEERRFVWDGYSIAECREGDGTTVTRRYYPQGFVDYSENPGGEAFYYLHDHLGSVRGIVDDTGTERARWAYTPYGIRSANQIATDPVESEFTFTGHYHHEPSGLVLAPFRAYSPELGRWISRDPIGEAGGINMYGYVGNDPINFWDPDGLNPARTQRLLDKFRVGSKRRPFFNPRSLRGPATPGTIWTRGTPNCPVKNVREHWKKHRDEFPYIRNEKEYAQTAHRELSNPTRESYIGRDAKGDIAVYDPVTNTLTIADCNVVPRTMFKPDPAKHGYPTNEQFVKEAFPNPVTP